jgi:hypothetical protein
MFAKLQSQVGECRIQLARLGAILDHAVELPWSVESRAGVKLSDISQAIEELADLLEGYVHATPIARRPLGSRIIRKTTPGQGPVLP